jgi:hypothetical protein
MPGDLLPLILGAAYACLGLSGLRLARLDGPLQGWSRLCVAGLVAAGRAEENGEHAVAAATVVAGTSPATFL